MTKKGSSLIIALLLLAVISTASFGIARLTMIEMNTSAAQAINTKAYYLAEGGIEENLLRWRYDHSAELMAGSRESDKQWQRELVSPGSTVIVNVGNDSFTIGINPQENYIGTTIFNKVTKAIGNVSGVSNIDGLVSYFDSAGFDESVYLNGNNNSRSDLKILKDDKITFGFPAATNADLDIAWRWEMVAAASGTGATTLDWTNRGTNTVGVEVRLFAKKTEGDVLLAKKMYSPAGNALKGADITNCSGQHCLIRNIRTQLNYYAAPGETYITLTPIGADIVVGAFGHDSSSAPADFLDSITHLESVGVTGGHYKGLEVKLDKNSGRILGLYDYVLFEGNRF